MREELLRIARLFLGLVIYAVGIVLTVHANIGLSPWDALHQGLAMHLGLTFGMTSILVSLLVVVCVALGKEEIGFGTLCNMVFIGAFIDVLMLGKFIPVAQTVFVGICMVTAGLFTIALASVLYMGAGYGAGPRDSLMVVFSKRARKPAGLCRSCVELTALTVGWLLGGHVWFGTVLSALGIGFAVQIVFKLLHFDVKSIRQESVTETITRISKQARNWYFTSRKGHQPKNNLDRGTRTKSDSTTRMK